MFDKLFVVIKVYFSYALDGFPTSFIVQHTKLTIIRKQYLMDARQMIVEAVWCITR